MCACSKSGVSRPPVGRFLTYSAQVHSYAPVKLPNLLWRASTLLLLTARDQASPTFSSVTGGLLQEAPLQPAKG